MRPEQNENQIAAQKLGLGDKQRLFARLFMETMIFAHLKGYEIVLETGWRSNEEAERLSKARGTIATKNSLHTKKLAHDISAFYHGKYLRDTEDYQILGEYFESLGGTWGGYFDDGGHFSIEHNGVR